MEVYHFTTLQSALYIVSTDTLKLGENKSGDKKYQYRFSFTRQMSAKTGYGRYLVDNNRDIVRIHFDYDLLKSKYKIEPFAWSNNKHYNIKNQVIKANSADDLEMYEYNKEFYDKQYDVENEERLYVNKSHLHDILKYINRIDVPKFLKDEFYFDTLKIQCRQNKINIQIVAAL